MNYGFKVFVAVVFLFLFYSCNREDVVPIEEIVVERQIRGVGVSDIPDIVEALEIKLGLKSNTESVFSVNDNGLIIDLKVDWARITEVIDTLGKTNYTFGIRDNDRTSFVFYNVVLGKTVSGAIKDPILLKFEMSDDFIPLFVETNSIAGFMGKITRTYLNQEIDGVGGSANLDTVFGIQGKTPCPPSTGSGGGGSTDPGFPDIYGTSTDGCDYYWIDYNDSEAYTGENGESGVTATQSVLAWLCGDDQPQMTVNGSSCSGNDDVAVVPPNVPCPGNPLQHMQITSFNEGVTSNVWGCTRVNSPTCTNGKREHRGLDLVASIGTPVHAMYSGTVVARAYSPTLGNYIYKRPCERSSNGHDVCSFERYSFDFWTNWCRRGNWSFRRLSNS